MSIENIEKMRQRHKDEIDELQRNCSHKKTKRMASMWAPGHFGSDVEVCDFCGRALRFQGGQSITI